MTDSNPLVFRNLERKAGRDGFDTIVRAAVASYSALQRPSDTQARDFGRLVIPLFDKTDGETRRILAASLSSSPKVPRPLVERLLAEPIEIAAPFLLASPLMTAEDLALLAKRRDPALKKLLTARRNAGTGSSPARRPSTLPSTDPTRRMPNEGRAAASAAAAAAPTIPPPPPSRQTALMSAGTPADAGALRSDSAEAPGTPSPSVERTREMLRRLALLGRSPDAAGPAPADLVSLAILKDRQAFYAALSRTLSLDPASVSAIEEDEGAERLAVALKAVGIGRADAMTIMMMIKPRIGVDVAAFEAMEQIYAFLDAVECAARFGLDVRPARGAPKHRPLYSEASGAVRAEPRPAFGRRKAVPGPAARQRGEK